MPINVENIHTDLYQFQKLKEIAAVINSGGGSTVDPSKLLPAGYSYEEDPVTGSLKLRKGSELIAVQNSDGSWFKTAVSTGVGSLHLGGGESSDPAHSLSSIGQNCGFKNEAFNATPESAVVWFPPWQGLSADIGTEYPATYLRFEPVQPAFSPNGIAVDDEALYDFVVTMASNLCIASVTTKAREDYSGKITNIIRSSKGVDLHVSSRAVNVTSGQEFTVNYPSLYFARNGDVLRLIMEKEDGSPLKVWRGSMNSRPWRTLRSRVFSDIRLDAKVTQTSDGLMSKEDKVKLDQLHPAIITDGFYSAYDFTTLSSNFTSAGGIMGVNNGTAGMFTASIEGSHFGVQAAQSGSTAGSSYQVGMLQTLFPAASEMVLTTYFKTPSSFDSNQLTVLGSWNTGLTFTNRSGLIIEGGNAFGGKVESSAAVETGSTYALTVSTWYICKFELLTDDKWKVTLYDDSGVQLYTYSSTTVVHRVTGALSWFGFKTQYKTTTQAIPLCSIDLIEFKAKATASRVKV
jgi:hypothetical protein